MRAEPSTERAAWLSVFAMTSLSRVVLFHGVEHRRPTNHWLWWIAEELRQRRIPVQYPQMPSPDAPRLDEWMALARAELGMLGSGDRIVVTHSLGGLMWSHLAPTLPSDLLPSRVLIVAPPSNSVLWDTIAHFAADDAARPGDFAPTTVLARARDEYRTGSLSDFAEAWGADAIEIEGEGHLTPDDGHGPLPIALEWILGPGA